MLEIKKEKTHKIYLVHLDLLEEVAGEEGGDEMEQRPSAWTASVRRVGRG